MRSTLRDPNGGVLFSQRRKVKARRSKHLAWQTTYTVNRPQLWSAETPNVYQLTIEILDKKSRLLEAISQDIGFRQVKIEEGQLRINGELVQIQGVELNKHPTPNKEVGPLEAMKTEIRSMKAHHVNAVRHLPRDPRWYALCTQMGLYVIDEFDLEGLNLGTNGKVEPASRLNHAATVVREHRNHPSIIAWSLGHEKETLDLMEQLLSSVKTLDPLRPIHYVRIEDEEVPLLGYDWVSSGSFDLNRTTRFSPAIAWSLGSFKGSFQRNWTQLDSVDGFQGAFIGNWKAIDPSDLLAAKYLWQPVDFIWSPDDPAQLILFNQQHFAELTGGELRWKVLENGLV
ncbi:MAG: glycoside hydrolase family 2 TIM barrel-domain containing protein, partial [Bacteroidota bacterium]